MFETQIETVAKEEIVDITDEVRRVVGLSKVDEGICVVFVPHTTAGVTINENADPDVKSDMLVGLASLVRNDFRFKHEEGNSVAHIKATIVGSSVMIPVMNGEIQLGRWQGIYFMEFDGPRRRSVFVQVK